MLETSEYRYVLLEESQGIVDLTLNRADKRNALSLEVMRELTSAFARIGEHRSNRVVILRGLGPAFSAGHDLREMLRRDVLEYRAIFDACVELVETIQRIPQPVIAEIDGTATAAGCQLVATCDLAIASSRSRFATPGVRIGLFCTTPMVALTRAVGRKRAMEMLLTGEFIDAETAADWGLINTVVPPESLRERVLQTARKIAEASPFVVALGKAAFYAQIDLDQGNAYTYAKEIMSTNALAEDAQEGIGAFVDKREPHWKQ